MRHLLFLDFDGVLHPDGEAVFSCREVLESYLLGMPDVDIVISSTWREDYSLPELQAFFSPSLHDRIIGVTPTLETGYDRGGRQREIEAYLQVWDVRSSSVSWVALDDLRHFFDDDCPCLIWVDPAKGFSHVEGKRLLAWYRGE